MPAIVLQIGPDRTCSKCGESKPVGMFSPAPRVKSGLQRECKSCVSKRASEWVRDNPERRNETRRGGRYHVDFNAMWDAQGGLCSMCHGAMLPRGKQARSVVVDHDRKCCPQRGGCCGKCVRGLIHSRCNILLGVLESESSTLDAAKKYLAERSGAIRD